MFGGGVSLFSFFFFVLPQIASSFQYFLQVFSPQLCSSFSVSFSFVFLICPPFSTILFHFPSSFRLFTLLCRSSPHFFSMFIYVLQFSSIFALLFSMDLGGIQPCRPKLSHGTYIKKLSFSSPLPNPIVPNMIPRTPSDPGPP